MRTAVAIGMCICVLTLGGVARAQAPLPTPQAPPQGAPLPPPASGAAPTFPRQELERLVSPIALYPDPLLAQVLAAATFAQQIPDAARWADLHHYLQGADLAAAIQGDSLPWDPSVQALLPFPSVLGMMASAMPWTQELGDAFLSQQLDVMDAVQAQRQRAMQFGYLQSNAQVAVTSGPYVEIRPVNPAYVVVPYYDPLVVFVAPRPGFRVATAVRFGYGVGVGVAFAPWGWGYSRFDWGTRVVVIDREPWRRTWVNRATYMHPYEYRRPVVVATPGEAHRVIERSEREREAEIKGRERREDHKREDDRKREEQKRADEKKRGRGGV